MSTGYMSTLEILIKDKERVVEYAEKKIRIGCQPKKLYVSYHRRNLKILSDLKEIRKLLRKAKK